MLPLPPPRSPRNQDYDRFCQIRRSVGFDEVVHYGTGLVLLFHGESGTGKTMTANALANHLHKRLLVVRGRPTLVPLVPWC